MCKSIADVLVSARPPGAPIASDAPLRMICLGLGLALALLIMRIISQLS